MFFLFKETNDPLKGYLQPEQKEKGHPLLSRVGTCGTLFYKPKKFENVELDLAQSVQFNTKTITIVELNPYLRRLRAVKTVKNLFWVRPICSSEHLVVSILKWMNLQSAFK